MTASDDVAFQLGAMIDDELVVSVRLRLNPTDAHHIATEQLAEVVGEAIGAVRGLPGTLAGVEVTMPTFEPYPDRVAP